MQYKNNKTLQLITQIGKVIRQTRLEMSDKSLNMFSYEYDLNPGNVSRIENGQIEAKITMLWRIAEALNIPLSELIKTVENELGSDFSISEK